MNKVLLLNGSPRGRLSATLKLAEAFLEGYTAEKEAEIRRVDLAGLDIGSCRGCYACWRSGSGACVQADAMAELLPAYAEADLVLLSTPVYHYGMTALLKAFFERTLPLNYPYMVKRGELYGHPWRRAPKDAMRFGLFATCGFPDEDAFRAMRVHFEKLLGQRLAFEFLCPEGALLNVPQLRELSAPRLAAMREAGASFAASGSVPPAAAALVAEPLMEKEAFARRANMTWSAPGEEPPTEAAFAGLEPYSPRPSPGPSAGAEGPPPPESPAPGPALALLRGMEGAFNPRAAGALEAILRFDFTDLGASYDLEIAGGRCALRAASAGRATTTIVVPFSTWERISRGELKGEEALMKGAYRVEGDFGLMMRMGSLFSPASGAEPAERKRRPNLMVLALLPWYFVWFLGGSSAWLGQLLPLALSLAFLAYREARREATWLERATPIALAFLSAIALASPSAMAGLYSALGNGAMAAIWASSLVYGRPLTSDYSKSGYSEAVASGLIFRRVNAILTGLWAALFGLGAVSGIAFAGPGQGKAAIANAALQVLAGAFTAWFPRWYPARLARRGLARGA